MTVSDSQSTGPRIMKRKRCRPKEQISFFSSSNLRHHCWQRPSYLFVLAVASFVSAVKSFQTTSFNRLSQRSWQRRQSLCLVQQQRHNDEHYSLGLQPHRPSIRTRPVENKRRDQSKNGSSGASNSTISIDDSGLYLDNVSAVGSRALLPPSSIETIGMPRNHTGKNVPENELKTNSSPATPLLAPATTNETLRQARAVNETTTALETNATATSKRNPFVAALDLSRFLPGFKDTSKTATMTNRSNHTIQGETNSKSNKPKRPSKPKKHDMPRDDSLSDQFEVDLPSPLTARFNDTLPDKKSSTDPLTLQDLQSFLVTNKFVREQDLESWTANVLTNVSNSSSSSSKSVSGKIRSLLATANASNTKAKSSSSVAFPQPSELSFRGLRYGTTVAASLCGMLLAVSIIPNLWLLGAILSALYGNDMAGKLGTDNAAEPTSIVPRLLLRLGRWLAETYLNAYDKVTILWFLYKTGQLSYEYFKRYEALDERFAIQDKVDAWNARFVQGKLAFDKWEQENEVGRKIIATLRTAWIVEEQSFKKMQRKRKSKYRLVQTGYDAWDAFKRLLRSVWLAITGQGGAEVSEFLEGLRLRVMEFRGENDVGNRLVACFVALFAFNMTGAVFTLSPKLISVWAIFIGLVWPSWWSEFAERLSSFADETRAIARHELQSAGNKSGTGSSSLSSSSSSSPLSLFSPRRDKNQYGSYVRPDGTKRYFLKAKPWFGPKEPDRQQSFWPWQTNKDKRKEGLAWLNPWQ